MGNRFTHTTPSKKNLDLLTCLEMFFEGFGDVLGSFFRGIAGGVGDMFKGFSSYYERFLASL